MRIIFSKYTFQILIGISAIILIWVSANMKWGDERWNSIIAHDANGLYGYLPAVFIYQDLSFTYYSDVVEDPSLIENKFYFKAKKHNDNVVNKYFSGTSLAIMPFFLVGHFVSWLMDKPLTGYSSYYLIFIQVATIFYALLGQFLLFKILRFYRISIKISALVMFAAVFGTNIYYYVTIEPGMSHVYSFAFVMLFVLSVLQFFSKPGKRSYLAAMFALGMVVLIRPVNGLILFSIPFLAGDADRLKEGFKYYLFNKSVSILGLLLAGGIVFIQLIIYKIQTGDFIVYSYANEGFNFLDVNIFNFLFSYRKGLFVYTPIFFISLFGLFLIYKRKPFAFFSLVLFLFVVVYVLSSWWMWYYGGSFGSRVFIEYYVFLLIPLAFWLENGKFRRFFIPLVLVFILICQIQTYQYQYGYIHWSEMNKERYWDNFLRIDKVINDEKKDW